ncbi:MAG: bifunctional molybdenum cofactor biosynthesis protein MoaC/MoaB [bacterium]|nr:bifunctional molybdenum cofactor biosynthesis protein MoaC/MoaB [bacterium]
MLDISHKYSTLRTAKAESRIHVSELTLQRINAGTIPKGNPLEVAKVAAVQAVKQTPSIVPYCHPIPIDFVGVDFRIEGTVIITTITVKSIAKTGVEMEALTAASVAALTLYDMLKMIDESLLIGEIKLLEKRGGKSDFHENLERTLTAAVIVMSDSIAAGKKSDSSGKAIMERLTQHDMAVEEYLIIPDEKSIIVSTINNLCDERKVDLILTTGGTGFSPRDTTPEAMSEIIDREIPGIPEAIRAFGQSRTPYSMLSRGKAGLRKNTLIVNLPGSKKGVAESLDALFPGLLHAFPMIQGIGSWKDEEKRAKR